MSSDDSSETSQTDWQRLRAMTDDEIDLSDLPEATAEEMSRGQLRLAGKPIPPGTVLVPLDAEVADADRQLAIMLRARDEKDT